MPKKYTFVGVLTDQQLEQFNKIKKKQNIIPYIQRKIQKEFPESVPVTARMNLYATEIYFYFMQKQDLILQNL